MDGIAIAKERIAREAREKSGLLDLGRLGLIDLPEELFALDHIRTLNLGATYVDDEDKWRGAASKGEPNSIQGSLGRLRVFGKLTSLFLGATGLSNLAESAEIFVYQTGSLSWKRMTN